MNTIFVVSCFLYAVVLSGCAQPTYEPKPEIPGAQQYYQMPGPYYTAPPPQLQYWDPRQDPLWQKEQETKNENRDLRHNQVYNRRKSI